MRNSMIAYNHSIKFIPELKDDKKVEGSFADVVTVQENANFNLDKKLLYELTFFNNQGRDISLWTDREFAPKQKRQLWAFEVKGVVTIFWHSGILSLEYIKYDNFTVELLEYWCLHIILPLFFTIEETYDYLHAGAVEVNEKPILFTAESYGGKSTMTDFFIRKEHTMISDDKVGTLLRGDQCYAIPSYAYHRPYRKMEDIGYQVQNFAIRSKPIHAIYALSSAAPDTEITIKELKGVEKFITLRFASENNLFFLKPKRFQYLAHIAKIIPVFSIAVPWNLDRLDEVYHTICQHSEGII